MKIVIITRLLFATIVAVISLFTTTAGAAVNYPVIGNGLRNNLTAVRSAGAFVGSEHTEIWEAEYVAITVPFHTEKGILFRANFVPVLELPGFYEPILTSFDGSVAARATADLGYFEYEDGSVEIYGSTNIMGQKVYFYSWSWLDGAGFEQWSVTLTWGPGSSIDNSGAEIDRTHFGTLPAEVPSLGYEIITQELGLGGFAIGLVYDTNAELTLEASINLQDWLPIASTVEEVPDAKDYVDGVEFQGIVIVPDLSAPPFSTSPRVFFRIK